MFIRPFPWQRFFLIHALELVNGRFRFRTVVLLVARQNGKTSIIEVKNLWKMFVLQVNLIIGTAQNLDIARESWSRALEIVEGTPELKAELGKVWLGNNKQEFNLLSGSRWRIAAINLNATGKRGGAGLSGDDVNLDELREHPNFRAWSAVTKTTLARSGAQIYGFSNAGDDTSVVLNRLQKQGRAAAKNPELADSSFGYFEYSAPDDTRCNCGRAEDHPHNPGCKLIDPYVLAIPNPSMNHPGGVTYEALVSAANTDPEAVFLTECLCVRVPSLGGRVIDLARWNELADEKSRRVGDVGIFVDIAPERDWAGIGVYGLRADNIGHLQLIDYRPGAGWVVSRLVELKSALDPVGIGMARGTYASIKDDLAKVGIKRPEDRPDFKDKPEPRRGELAVMTAPDMGAACGQLIDAVRDGTLRYVPSQQLTIAVGGARTRMTGDAVTWSRTDKDTDVTPIVAVTGARWVYHERVNAIQEDDYDPEQDLW
ncbi:MAG TPA: hypothetical protein VFR23_20700 [Jiangellaceae bacterium]|nr:hypothetical protein [Jiangellaceae bacterium]